MPSGKIERYPFYVKQCSGCDLEHTLCSDEVKETCPFIGCKVKADPASADA